MGAKLHEYCCDRTVLLYDRIIGELGYVDELEQIVRRLTDELNRA